MTVGRLAAVTMVYEEPDFLPIWVRHYAAQVGAENCFIIDHGGADGSTDHLPGVQVIRIPRSVKDEGKRCRFISNFVGALLEWYDWVIHADVDEIVVADPAIHRSLVDYVETCDHEVASCIGFNLIHANGEPPFDPARLVLEQRDWVHFVSSMCKPVLTRRPIRWTEGFHRADAPAVFDDLFLFHLRWFDRDIGRRRLAHTRAQPPRAKLEQGWWQRVSDEEGEALFDGMASRPGDPTVRLHANAPAVSAALSQATVLDCQAEALWKVPPRFRTVF